MAGTPVMDRNLQSVRARLTRLGPQPSERVLVAFSGGRDSTALAIMLSRLGQEIALGHVDHGMRSGSEADAVHCRHIAELMSQPYVGARLPKPPRSETEARAGRYRELRELADRAGASWVATGHTKDDQAETVLLKLGRGGHPMGIPERRARVIRPLLGLRRIETRVICEEAGIHYLDDPTNSDESILRNRVRHRVLDGLEESVVGMLVNWGEHARSEAREVDASVDRAIDDVLIRLRMDGSSIDGIWLAESLPATRRAVLTRVASFHGIEFNPRLMDSVDEVAKGRKSVTLSLPRGWSAVGGDSFEIRPSGAETSLPSKVIQIPGKTVIGAWGIVVDVDANPESVEGASDGRSAVIDASKVTELLVRQRRPGDRFRPLGMSGTKKLKDFFIDEKVPVTERDRVPVFVSRDQIVWVGGHRISEDFKLTHCSDRRLRLKLSRI